MTRTSRPQRTRATAAVALALLVAGTAACGDGSDDGGAGGSGSPTTTADSPAAAIEITAVDYRFENLPAELAAGAMLTLRNQSSAEVHELVAMRLANDESRTVATLVALPEQELRALFAGPPSDVLVAPPGKDGFAAVGDGTLSDPGRYLFMCFIPTGADTTAYLDALQRQPGQPPSVPGGPPHFTAGMYGEAIVR